MIYRALALSLCALCVASAQQVTVGNPAVGTEQAVPAAAGGCSAESSNPFAMLLCAAKAKLADWEKADRELTPQISLYCDRTRVYRVVKQLQESRRPADEAFVAYFQERKQFIDEQIADLKKEGDRDNEDLNRKIAKTKLDLDQNNAMLDQKKKELETIPANATDTYKDSLKEVIKVLGQQAGNLLSTVKALQDTIDKRVYIEKEWENQQIVAQKMMENARSIGESLLARYAQLAELQLSRCVAGVAGSESQQQKP